MIKILKYIYKTLGIVILKKQTLIIINRLKRRNITVKLNIKTFSLKNKHVFFGYYDLNPISIEMKQI